MHRSGLTTIECLMALVVFTLGVLGAVATTALAIRVQASGDRAAAAGRLSGNVLDSLQSVFTERGGRCDAIGGGASTDSRGTVARWQVDPETGGLGITLTLAQAARTVAETVWTFTPCR